MGIIGISNPEMHFIGEIELVKGRGYFNVEKENASRDASTDCSYKKKIPVKLSPQRGIVFLRDRY